MMVMMVVMVLVVVGRRHIVMAGRDDRRLPRSRGRRFRAVVVGPAGLRRLPRPPPRVVTSPWPWPWPRPLAVRQVLHGVARDAQGAVGAGGRRQRQPRHEVERAQVQGGWCVIDLARTSTPSSRCSLQNKMYDLLT